VPIVRASALTWAGFDTRVRNSTFDGVAAGREIVNRGERQGWSIIFSASRRPLPRRGRSLAALDNVIGLSVTLAAEALDESTRDALVRAVGWTDEVADTRDDRWLAGARLPRWSATARELAP
jgi:hypothetical protein